MKAEQTSIDSHFNTTTAMNIDCNKQMLASITETILFCGHQIFHLEDIENLPIQTTQVILSPCYNFKLTMVMKY